MEKGKEKKKTQYQIPGISLANPGITAACTAAQSQEHNRSSEPQHLLLFFF